MQITNLLSIALAVAPAVVSAAGTFGFALGNQRADGSCKGQSDYEDDFDTLKPYSTLVRTYSASSCNTTKYILPAARNKGFKVVLGVWPDVPASFDADVQALKDSVPGNEDIVEAITVGSETIYRGTFTGQELLSKIQEVQAIFPKTTIGTADSWNKFYDGSADALVTGGVNYLLVNAFPYWQAQEISNATRTYFYDISLAKQRIEKVAGPNAKNIRVINGETGWPTTGGTNYGAALASTSNAETFFKDGVCAMLAWGTDVFYFEAFDEPFKPNSVGDNGQAEDETHWGFFTATRETKFQGQC